MDDQTQTGQPVQPWAPPGDASGPPAGPAAEAPPPGPEAAAPAPAAPAAPPVSWGAAPPVAPGIPVPGAAGIFFASIWARFAAYLVDALIIVLLEFVIAFVIGVAMGTASRGSGASLAIGSLLGFVVSFAYFVPQWRGSQRATFGMRAFSVQIGNAFDGVPLTSRQAILRWVAMGYPLGLLSGLQSTAGIAGLLILLLELALFLTTLGSTTRQGWHDQLANSAVIRRPGTSGSNSAAIAVAIVLLVVFGIAIFAIIGLVFLGGAISDILSTVGSSI